MIYRTAFMDVYSKWLVFLSLLFLFGPHNIPYVNRLIFIILFLILFSPVFIIKDNYLLLSSTNIPNKISNLLLFLLIGLQFVLAEYVSRYYTGMSLFKSFSAIFEGGNNYAIYQSYFSDNELGAFSISKLPAIIALAIVKGIFLYSMSVFMVYRNIQKPQYFLFLTVIPLILFSISRGTFFEVFEILLCIFYFYKTSSKVISKPVSIKTFKNYFYLLIASIFLTFIFTLNASRRFEDGMSATDKVCSIKEFCFDPYTSFISLENSLYFLAAYFSTGIYFITEYVTILFNGELISSLLPLTTTSYFSLSGNNLLSDFCNDYVACGVYWTPDLFDWFSFFGFSLTLIVFPLFFYASFKAERKLLSKLNLFSLPLGYLLLVYIVSIPVGSFYTTSSSNILCTVFFIIFWFFKSKK